MTGHITTPDGETHMATWTGTKLDVDGDLAGLAETGGNWYNPVKGGSYRGFDLTDQAEAHDFLVWLGRQDGFEVTIEDASQAEGLPYPRPDDRHEATRLELAEPTADRWGSLNQRGTEA